MSSELFQDAVTGLPTIRGWSNSLPEGILLTAGSIVVADLAGCEGEGAASDALPRVEMLQESTQRLRSICERNMVLARGSDGPFFLWIPFCTEALAHEVINGVRQVLTSPPLQLAEGQSIVPSVRLAVHRVPANTRVFDAVEAVMRLLAEQPAVAPRPRVLAHPQGLEALTRSMAAMSEHGYGPFLAQAMTAITGMDAHPRMVMVVGEPQCGKSRLLATLTRRLRESRHPIATAVCQPGDHTVAGHLLVTVLYQWLSQLPVDARKSLTTLTGADAWLGGLFPALSTTALSPEVPTDPQVLQQGLQALLSAMMPWMPCFAVVQNLQRADSLSLTVLADAMHRDNGALRVLAGVEPAADGNVPSLLGAFPPAVTTTMPLPALSQGEVLRYLQELSADLGQAEIAQRVYEATHGLLLPIDLILRSWVLDGVLDYVQGRWLFHSVLIAANRQATLSPEDLTRLGKAALAEPISVELLQSLWQVRQEEVQPLLEIARALGYVKPIDRKNPRMVQCSDPDYANSLIARLEEQERAIAHGEIGTLLASSPPDAAAVSPQQLAYHFTEAGQTLEAERYLRELRLSTRALTEMLAEQQQESLIAGQDYWDIPQAGPLEPRDYEKMADAVLAVRLAGVQFRLYPASSDIVRTAVHDAVKALNALFAARPSLVISFDGRNIAFDNQVFQRRDLHMAVRDYQQWMSEGNICAIGIRRNVHESELLTLLQTLGAYERREGELELQQRVEALKLANIKVLTWRMLPDVVQLGARVPHSGLLASLMSNLTESLAEISSSLPARGGMGRGAAGQPSRHAGGGHPTGGVSAAALLSQANDPGQVPDLGDPEVIDDRTWMALSGQMESSPARARRTVMSNVVRWLEQQRQQTQKGKISENIDQFLLDRLRCEEDVQALGETAVALEYRLEGLMEQRAWDKIIELLEPFARRMHDARTTSEERRQLAGVLSRIGESTVLRLLIHQMIEQPDDWERAHRVVRVLGEFALRPIITELKNSSSMEERARLMQLLREFGASQQRLIVQELRGNNDWFVYRNLLQAVAEFGSEESLPAISEKIRHPDPRVRAEAVAAATRIARERGENYLALGLEDPDPNVRARATTLISHCPLPRILHQVLQILQSRVGGANPANVQLSATLGLGAFAQDEAREALMQIISPRLLSPYRGKDDEIRSAAITALAQHLPHPRAEACLRQALTDKSMLVRQSAQRALHQQRLPQ